MYVGSPHGSSSPEVAVGCAPTHHSMQPSLRRKRRHVKTVTSDNMLGGYATGKKPDGLYTGTIHPLGRHVSKQVLCAYVYVSRMGYYLAPKSIPRLEFAAKAHVLSLQAWTSQFAPAGHKRIGYIHFLQIVRVTC